MTDGQTRIRHLLVETSPDIEAACNMPPSVGIITHSVCWLVGLLVARKMPHSQEKFEVNSLYPPGKYGGYKINIFYIQNVVFYLLSDILVRRGLKHFKCMRIYNKIMETPQEIKRKLDRESTKI